RPLPLRCERRFRTRGIGGDRESESVGTPGAVPEGLTVTHAGSGARAAPRLGSRGTGAFRSRNRLGDSAPGRGDLFKGGRYRSAPCAALVGGCRSAVQ